MKPFRTIRAQRGAALPLALLVLLLVSVLGFTLVTLGTTEVSIATNWRTYSTTFYAADAGIESGVVNLRSLLQQNPNGPTQAQLNQIAAPALPNAQLNYTTYSVALAPWMQGQPPYQMTMSGAFSGLSGLVTDYQVTSNVRGPGGTQARLAQIVKYIQVPLFQFAVFYGKGVDMEIEPGPAMTLNGKIFSNSNIYLGADNSLTIQSNDPNHPASVKAAGQIYRTVKSSVTSFSSTINPVTGTYDPTSYAFAGGSPANPQIANASGVLQNLNFDVFYQPGGSSKWSTPDGTPWASQANSTFGGTVADGAMGVGEITPPLPALLANANAPNPAQLAHQLIELPSGSDSPQLAAAKLYAQAALRVVDGVATDQSGNPVSLPAGTITTTSFYDERENKTVNLYQVDVSKLNNGRPKNGVLYVGSSAAPTSTTAPGVRLVNGSDLSTQGLTVVSPNPVYIQGDYNTKTYGTFKDPVTGSNTHAPAAVIADAVTFLSNNWQPNNSDASSKSCASCGTDKRPATTTTVNAAIMTGPSVESATGAGNGQLENDIRFLEDWKGVPLNYTGSIVSLWHSTQAAQPWRCCGTGGAAPNQLYYSPPSRNWSYDNLFTASPPPGTPQGVLILKGAWSQN